LRDQHGPEFSGTRLADICAPLNPKVRHTMNEDRIKGRWKQLSGKLKAKWGKLTDDDLQVVEGDSEYLVGRIQERYGIAREEAERQLKDFDSTL
jgi:uncharacterized protein YjbJ (UPF0337 family)